jgi:hypothetical protein
VVEIDNIGLEVNNGMLYMDDTFIVFHSFAPVNHASRLFFFQSQIELLAFVLSLLLCMF